MADWLDTISTHWFWLSLGLILGVGEMLLPGFFLIWLGLAAIIVGRARLFPADQPSPSRSRCSRSCRS